VTILRKAPMIMSFYNISVTLYRRFQGTTPAGLTRVTISSEIQAETAISAATKAVEQAAGVGFPADQVRKVEIRIDDAPFPWDGWQLRGKDGFDPDAGYYDLGSIPDGRGYALRYVTRELAMIDAYLRLDELEELQPSKDSGGQNGIQDRVYLVSPEGDMERVWSHSSAPEPSP
jgi:hypothetical protein